LKPKLPRWLTWQHNQRKALSHNRAPVHLIFKAASDAQKALDYLTKTTSAENADAA
jgi:antirestriction protein ArdC